MLVFRLWGQSSQHTEQGELEESRFLQLDSQLRYSSNLQSFTIDSYHEMERDEWLRGVRKGNYRSTVVNQKGSKNF